MDITLEYVKEKFDFFNDLCFEGSLKPLPFRITNARTFLGMIRCKRRRNPDRSWYHYNFEFVISSKSENVEKESIIEDVILHEMIHYFILSNQISDTSAHGEVFRRLMRDINLRFKRHITVSHRRTKAEADKDQDIRLHVVCIARLERGGTALAACAHTRLFELWAGMPKIPGISSLEWYATKDPYFNRFPRVLKPKLYLVRNPEEAREHLKTAKRIVWEGRELKLVNQ